MATSKEFHDYVMEQLSRIGECTSRKMMGEYCIYYKEKPIGDLCDNIFLLKPTDAVLRLLPDAERGYPYEGSKTQMVIVDEIENTELLAEVIAAMHQELPEPKARKEKIRAKTKE